MEWSGISYSAARGTTLYRSNGSGSQGQLPRLIRHRKSRGQIHDSRVRRSGILDFSSYRCFVHATVVLLHVDAFTNPCSGRTRHCRPHATHTYGSYGSTEHFEDLLTRPLHVVSDSHELTAMREFRDYISAKVLSVMGMGDVTHLADPELPVMILPSSHWAVLCLFAVIAQLLQWCWAHWSQVL